MNRPKLSIITACLNSAGVIHACLESVASICAEEIEHIVIDGGSTDGTVEILREAQATWHPRLRWLSEPDGGIADAMNKGIKLARGEWYWFIQSDDRVLSKNQFETIFKSLDYAHADLYAHSILLIKLDGAERVICSVPWGIRHAFRCGLRHQGTLYHRSVFEELGLYNDQFKIAMDYEFNLRCQWNGKRLVISDQVVAIMQGEGVGSRTDWLGLKLRFKEERKAHYMQSPHWGMTLVYYVFWMVYPIYRKLMHLYANSFHR